MTVIKFIKLALIMFVFALLINIAAFAEDDKPAKTPALDDLAMSTSDFESVYASKKELTKKLTDTYTTLKSTPEQEKYLNSLEQSDALFSQAKPQKEANMDIYLEIFYLTKYLSEDNKEKYPFSIERYSIPNDGKTSFGNFVICRLANKREMNEVSNNAIDFLYKTGFTSIQKIIPSAQNINSFLLIYKIPDNDKTNAGGLKYIFGKKLALIKKYFQDCKTPYFELNNKNIEILFFPDSVTIEKTQDINKAKQGIIIDFRENIYLYVSKNPFDKQFKKNRFSHNIEYMDNKTI